MIKKYNKIFITTVVFFLLMFFNLITTVSAKEVTLEELSEKIKDIKPDTTYLYIVGEYAFTSEHLLTTQDIMLAARTIKVSENSGKTNSDEIYNEMSIVYLEGTYDNDWNLEGLEYVSNMVGTTQQQEKYNINYIDYIAAFNNIAVSELVNEVYNTIDTTTANDKFEVSKTGNTINVTVLDNTMNSVLALQGTGVATAAENLLNEYGVKTVTLEIPGTEIKVEISKDNLMNKLGEINTLFTKLAGTTDATAGDLAGKLITVSISLEDGCTTNDEKTFTVKFDKKEIEVKELINEAYKTIETASATSNNKFTVSKTDNTISVMMLDTTMDSVLALQGTGVATAAENLLNEYGVKTVTLAIPNTTSKVEVTAENITQKFGELNDLFKALANKENATAGDIAGKLITVSISLEDGCTTNDEKTFTVKFDKKEIEVKELINEAYKTIETASATSNNKFTVSKTDNTISVMMLDITMDSVLALQGTGVATAAENLLNEYGVKTVTLAIPNTTSKVEVTAENITQKFGELNDLFKALANKENATAGDLAGKSITVSISLENGCTTNDETTFTVKFDKKEIEVKELIDEAYNTIEEAVATSNNKFTVSKEGNNTINVTIIDTTMDSVLALQGTGVATAAENLLNEYGVEKVTIAIPNTTSKVEVSAENITQKFGELNDLFKAVAQKENATAADLIGKTIEVIIGINAECIANGNTTFTVNF